MTTIIRGEEIILAQWRLLELVSQDTTVAGTTKTFEFARRAPGVRIIISAQDGSDKILLSREWRSELNRYDYRLPGGKVFDSLTEFHQHRDVINEYAKNAVIREAKEEVGITVKDMELLWISHCGATIVWDLYYFEVTDYALWEQELEEWEVITYDFYDSETIKTWCLDGTIDEERSAIVLLRYLLH